QLENMTRWLEQKIRPLHHPFCVARPVAVEGLLHPFGVGGAIASFDDTFQVNVGTAGGVVRPLAGKRIVKHNCVCHPQDVSTRRKRGYRLMDSRGKAITEYDVYMRVFVLTAQFHLLVK